MSRLSKTVKGIAVLDPYWTEDRLLASDTTATEAGPMPGTMETDSVYAKLVPQLLDQQSASAVLSVVSSGVPGAGIGIGQVEVAYKLATESDDDYRYCDLPLRLNDWGSPGTVTTPDDADCVTFPSGITFHVWTKTATEVAYTWDPYAEAFAAATTYADDEFAYAVVPNTERLLMIGLGATGPSRYSDDYGVTWTEYTTQDAPTSISAVSTDPAPLRKRRAAFDGAGNLMFAGIDTVDGSVDSFASADQGVTWEEIALAAPVGDYDLASHPNGSLVFGFLNSGGLAKVTILGSAYDSMITSTSVDVFDGSLHFDALTFQKICVGVDAAGVIWVFAEDDAADGSWAVAASYDGGETWFSDWHEQAIPYAIVMGDTANRVCSMRFAPAVKGGLIASMSFGQVAGSGVGNGGVGWFGGWRSSPMLSAQYGSFGDDDDGLWMGFKAPQSVGTDWTLVGSGTVSMVHTGSGPKGYAKIEATASAFATYLTRVLSSLARGQAECKFAAQVDADGSNAQCIGVSMFIQTAASNKESNVTIFMQTDGFRVRDVTAGAWLGAKVSVDLTKRTHFEAHFNRGGAPVVSYRQDGSTVFTSTTWSAVAPGASVATGVTVAWGILNGVANAQCRFWYMEAKSAVYDSSLGRFAVYPLSVGASIGSDFGVSLPDLASNDRPCRLVLRGSLGLTGEVYDLPVAPDYALSSVFPDSEPSPSRTWRSTETALRRTSL
jgi:hypothetical protein